MNPEILNLGTVRLWGRTKRYADAYVGETLGEAISYQNNHKTYFKVRETRNFRTELYPCTCGVPKDREIVAPTESSVGYTVNTCPQCGYTNFDHFIPRILKTSASENTD